MKGFKRLFGAALSVCLSMAVMLGAVGPVTAHAYEYTYQATVYAGNLGRLTSGVDITVNNRKSGSNWTVDKSSDRIVIKGLSMGDVVSIDVAADGAVLLDAGSPYYVLGLRDSGRDNSEAGYGAFRVDRDRDFVVAYGMRTDETTYTVYYQALDGTVLAAPRTYTGNVGDKPVVAYLYVDGYEPLSYNVTKTLSKNSADNAMTFIYKPLESQEIRVSVPGDNHYVHVPGGSYTVDVPGPTIVQRVPSSNSNNNTGNGGGGTIDDTGAVSNPSGPATGGDNGQGGTGGDGGQGGGQTGGNGQTGGGDANNPGQAGGGQNGGGDVNNPDQAGGNNGQSGDNGQNGGDNGQGGNNNGQAGGNNGQGENTDLPGVNLDGTGTHGQRPDANQPGGDTSSDDGTSSGSSYKPGGSLDVVISSDYTPSQVIDLDENPSGIPMVDTPNADGSYNAGDGGQDPAMDGMNENTENTGTGQLEPEPSGGLPIVPIICGVVGVIAVGAGVIIFVTYKKQHSGDDDDGGDE